MEKQVLVINYVGEPPTPEAAGAAIVAMNRAGTYMDTTVQPTMTCLDEKEVGQAIYMFSNKKIAKKEGITINVSTPEYCKDIDSKKMAKVIAVLKEVFNV